MEGIDGKYQFRSSVGRGSFGTVFRAESISDASVCAVHVLEIPPQRGTVAQEVLDRFATEAPRLLKLDHPSLARVLDAGVVGDRPYLASELAEGKTLRDELMVTEGLDETTASEIARSLLAALAELHRNGVSHGNLKPENVMLAGSDRVVKLIDVGVAHVFRKGDLTTSPDPVLPSPRYTAPEQFRADPTPASDVYAAGLVLWEMLCGEPAIDSTSLEECMDAHLGSDRWALPDDLAVSDELRAAIEKALQRHPRKRFADAGEFLESLESISTAEVDEWETDLVARSESFDFDSVPISEVSHTMIDPNVDASQEPELLSDAFDDEEPLELDRPPALGVGLEAPIPPATEPLELDRPRRTRPARRAPPGQVTAQPSAGTPAWLLVLIGLAIAAAVYVLAF